MRLAAEAPARSQRPVATIAIAAVTTLVSLLVTLGGVEIAATDMAGVVPARLSGILDWPGAIPAWLTPLSSTLVHGGLTHLAMNMLVLLFVGTKVEQVLGRGPLVLAYLVGAYVAGVAQWAVDPRAITPMIGASGAISALFGIYALMFGRVRRTTGKFALDRTLHAAWVLASWIVLQWMMGALMSGEGVLLATPAHIGGFVGGMLMQRPLLKWRYRTA